MIFETPLLLVGLVATSLNRSYLVPNEKKAPAQLSELFYGSEKRPIYSATPSPSPVPAISFTTKSRNTTSMALITSELGVLSRSEVEDLALSAQQAARVLDKMPAGVPTPVVNVSNSDSVVLVFRQGDEYADIEFKGDGFCFLYCRNLEKTTGEGVEDIEVGDGTLPVRAVDMLLNHFAPFLLSYRRAA